MGIERERERENSPFLSLFVLFRPSMDWLRPTYIGKGSVLYSDY